jgi:hypothetical protein
VKRITLPAWGSRHFDPPPAARTLERWARFGRIHPQPIKVGNKWRVDPEAKYVDRNGHVTA